MSYRAELEALTFKLRVAEDDNERLEARVAELRGLDQTPVIEARDRALEAAVADRARALEERDEAIEAHEQTLVSKDEIIAELEEQLAELDPAKKRATSLGVKTKALNERIRQLEEEQRMAQKLSAPGAGLEGRLAIGAGLVIGALVILVYLMTNAR